MGWAGQNLARLEKKNERKRVNACCLMSLWNDGRPLAICQAALLSIYQCKLPTIGR